jgi:hypothetical protein
MSKNIKVILPAMVLGLVLGGAAVYKTGLASARFGADKGNSNMAQGLSEKLNVSKDQVTGAMDQIRTENQEKRRTEISANLDKAVTDGVITADQKQKIVDHKAELQKQREERVANEKKWVADSGIDFSKLAQYHVGFMGEGRGYRGGK